MGKGSASLLFLLSPRQSAWPSIVLDVNTDPTIGTVPGSLPQLRGVQMSVYVPNSRLSSMIVSEVSAVLPYRSVDDPSRFGGRHE